MFLLYFSILVGLFYGFSQIDWVSDWFPWAISTHFSIIYLNNWYCYIVNWQWSDTIRKALSTWECWNVRIIVIDDCHNNILQFHCISWVGRILLDLFGFFKCILYDILEEVHKNNSDICVWMWVSNHNAILENMYQYWGFPFWCTWLGKYIRNNKIIMIHREFINCCVDRVSESILDKQVDLLNINGKSNSQFVEHLNEQVYDFSHNF